MLLVLHLRAARRRAGDAATAEAVALLRDLDARAAPGGPLSEQRGVAWVSVPDGSVPAALPRLPRLGYAEAVDLVVPDEESDRWAEGEAGRPVRWRRRPHRLLRVHREDPAALRELAPDRREFLLQTGDGEVRAIRGYRGGEDPLTHRALPVPDARLLVNLVSGRPPGVLLDPFAGAGGIVIEAVASGWRVVSADVDPALRHGLARLGAKHLVADARHLPLATASVDAAATEPPYDPGSGGLAAEALAELRRVLRPGGRIAMLCAGWQRPGLVGAAAALGLVCELDTAVDRKGLQVAALAWRA
jgi:SAM-dependent methyltransferase